MDIKLNVKTRIGKSWGQAPEIVAVADVAAQERRPPVRRKRVYERPEPLHAAATEVLLARLDVHAERDAGPADEERVVVVARPSRLYRVVAEFRALL